VTGRGKLQIHQAIANCRDYRENGPRADRFLAGGIDRAGCRGRSRARLRSVALVSVGCAARGIIIIISARRERQARPRERDGTRKTEHHGRHMRSCCRGGCQRRRRLRGDTLGVPSCTSASGCPWYQASMTSEAGRGDAPVVPRRETRAITSSGARRARRASARFASRDSDRCRLRE